MTGETWEVPADMTDAGAGYLCVSGEYIYTLEPALYRFTFVESVFEAEINVHVYSAEEVPQPIPKENYFLYEPLYYGIGVLAALDSSVSCRFTGVSIVSEDKEIPIEPIWYTIACDGQYMLIKRDFIKQYEEMGSVMLIYHFDNGERYQAEVSLKSQ